MKELAKQLTTLGLNEKQAAVYIATMELGSAPALEISQSAQVKRPTTYVVLGELQTMGLVTEVKTGSTTLFLAQKPAALGNRIEQQLQAFQSIKPLLSDLYLKEGARPSVSYYSGIDEVRAFYKMFLMEHSEIDLLATDLKLLNAHFGEVFESLDEHFSRSGYTVREVVTTSVTSLPYARRHSRPYREVRILEQPLQLFGNTALFGNTVVTVSFHNDPFAVAIESRELSQTFRSLFEVAWQAAGPHSVRPLTV